VIQTRRVTRREQRCKKGSEDKGVAQRAGIKESVGNIRPVWPLHMLGRSWAMDKRGSRKKRRGTSQKCNMVKVKNSRVEEKEVVGHEGGREMNYFDAVPKDA